MQYWNDLSIDFMSEESDDPDDSNCLIIHKLPWVSESKFKVEAVLIITGLISRCFNHSPPPLSGWGSGAWYTESSGFESH